MSELVGIDTGGTFTDFILYKNGTFVTYKIPSTPDAPEKAIIAGLKHLNIAPDVVHIVHGTTVATNALLEGKGAKTAFITNQGLKDILHIGRQARLQLYSLCPRRERQLIERTLCFELEGRLQADGSQLEPMCDQQLDELKTKLNAQGVEAVAICMLFSFLNDTHELAVEQALQADYFVSRSSQILPEQREYERGIVTWLNSFLGPIAQRYLHDLQSTLTSTIHVMQSDATTQPAVSAGKQAVRLLLSGPAGGVVAATNIAKSSGHRKLLTLDMGGTSTDVSLIDHQPSYTNEGHVAEFPLAIPMLDIHTIGAGGGSIARLDEAGGLHVGPESAGAQPGPACYGHGGTQATITDANVVLGRLPVTQEWSGGISLNKTSAQHALKPIADEMNCSIEEAATGIIQLANAHMVQALRVISIHRGHDPCEFSLFPFGGAGGLHMCAVAEELSISSILVPVNAGILSAQGMLAAPVGEMVSKSVCQLWSQLDNDWIENVFAQLQEEAKRRLAEESISCNRASLWLDLRYRGQSSVISLQYNLSGNLLEFGEDIDVQFQQAHQQRFGFSLAIENIELVTARVWAYQDVPELNSMPITQGSPASPSEFTNIFGIQQPVPVYLRHELVIHQILDSPCIVLDDSGTIYVEKGWQAKVTEDSHIYLQLHTDHP